MEPLLSKAYDDNCNIYDGCRYRNSKLGWVQSIFNWMTLGLNKKSSEFARHCTIVVEENIGNHTIQIIDLTPNNSKDEVLEVIQMEDVIGAEVLSCTDYGQDFDKLLRIYSYPKSNGMKSTRVAKHYEIAVSDSVVAEACMRKIQSLCSHDQSSTVMISDGNECSLPNNTTGGSTGINRKYLIIVNPVSGKKNSSKICKQIVKPMFDQAGISYEVFVTQYGNQAKEWASCEHYNISSDNQNQSFPEYNLNCYSAVITIGGDGLLAELLQGVQLRKDNKSILANIPFGIIGGGTSNGLAASILHVNSESFGSLESTFLICKGKHSCVDLSKYETSLNVYWSFLTFSWGIIADVDLESEVIRCLGILRNDIWAVYRIINLRTYRGRFSYLPAKQRSINDNSNQREVTLPLLSENIPSNSDWLTIEDDFILFWACQVSHAASNTFNSPDSKLDDGLFRILVVRASCSRLELVKMFLEIETGGHVKHEACEIYECVAFRLEPLCEGSYNDIDGESVEKGTIQGKVVPNAFKMFA